MLFPLVIDLIGHVEELGGVIGSRLVTEIFFPAHLSVQSVSFPMRVQRL